MKRAAPHPLDTLRDRWRLAWPRAIDAWSRFTKLAEPRWCVTEAHRRAERLSGSFAMIRLNDHAVVIGLEEVVELGLEDFAVEILAHEIGHHVYAPGDLVDNARALARIRRGIPTREVHAPLVANLYTDLLINDRLQRSAGLRMDAIYKALRKDGADALWALYMRTYEILWQLPWGTLVDADAVSAQVNADAALAARLVRVYARAWLDGAGRFGCLLLPYLLQQPEGLASLVPWLDTTAASVGGEVPDGLAEIEDDEMEGAIHPGDDPAITGIDNAIDAQRPDTGASGREEIGGGKNRYREPTEYVALMRSLGVDIDEKDLVIRYYRECALAHIVPFPVRESREAGDPQPEGLETWDPGGPLNAIDWTASVVRSPLIVPGVTTVERVYGVTEGDTPARLPVDLYLGIDCSGSMSNPAFSTSYPVLAGTVISLSALRAGSRVMAELSGEPGQFSASAGFVRNEREILRILTGYLGTGYAYGVKRLEHAILEREGEFTRAVHLLIVTDSDIFHMLDSLPDGWMILERAASVAGGGATLVLDIQEPDRFNRPIERIRHCGWAIHTVTDQSELVAFAREFSRRHYERHKG